MRVKQAQAPLRKCQLQLEELTAAQRKLDEDSAQGSPSVYSERLQQAALGRRLARRLGKLQLFLTASTAEVTK